MTTNPSKSKSRLDRYVFRREPRQSREREWAGTVGEHAKERAENGAAGWGIGDGNLFEGRGPV